jgi:hypothetical protein
VIPSDPSLKHEVPASRLAHGGMPCAGAEIARLLLLLLVAVSAASCASSRAQMPEDAPTLVVPPVPPREIEPLPTTELPVVETVPNLPTTAAPPPTRPKGPVKEGARNNNNDKPDPKTDIPAETSSATPVPPPVPQLRTPSTPEGPEAARRARETLERASKTLYSVDFNKLSDERKSNYNAAKDYLKQAEDALKVEDFSAASAFATRAENIARQIGGVPPK